MPSCSLTSLTRDMGGVCGKSYTPAGVQDRIYIFNIESLTKPLPEPGNDGFYPISVLSGVEKFAIDIKRDSGQVTSSKNESDESRSVECQAVINYALDKFLPIDAAMAFMNVGVIVPIDSTKAYVIMSPYRRTQYSSDFDSGTTYDSDHGFTIKFTASPVLYACPMISLTGINLPPTPTYNNSYYQTVTSITISGETTVGIASGSNTLILTAAVNPNSATVTWLSSDETVATVSDTGVVTGLKNGTVTITASAGSKVAEHTVKVGTGG